MGFVPKGFSLSIGAVDGDALSRGFPALAAKFGARLQGRATLRARGGLHRRATLLAELRPCAIDRSTAGAGNTAAAHSTTATRLRVVALAMMTPATMVATKKSVKDTHDCSSFLSYKINRRSGNCKSESSRACAPQDSLGPGSTPYQTPPRCNTPPARRASEDARLFAPASVKAWCGTGTGMVAYWLSSDEKISGR